MDVPDPLVTAAGVPQLKPELETVKVTVAEKP